MKEYSIYLTGGQIINLSANDLEIFTDRTGVISTMNWYNANKQIKHLNPQHISAIVEV
jgi:hypothetical protein